MKRWNGWGDDTITQTLAPSAATFLQGVLAPGVIPRDVQLAEVARKVPASRLPVHPLVSVDAVERVRHACGQSFPDLVATRTGQIAAFPDGVALPTTGAEVRELLTYAQAVGARVIPYGGGTSVVGHINPLPGDAPVLTLDMGRMNGLLVLDERSALATFGAGVAGPDLEAQLRAQGYTLGHFPQSFEHSTLGGWIATRSSGQQSLHYGRIERLFAGGTVETPSGSLTMPPFPASAAGPDLRELVLGSEGRMGIITTATVRVSPLPAQESFRGIFFPSFEAGMLAAQTMVRARLPLSMLRVSTAVETETNLALAGHPWMIGALERWVGLQGAGAEKSLVMVGATGEPSVCHVAWQEVGRIARAHKGVSVGRVLGDRWRASRFRTPYLRNTLWTMGYGVDTLETAVEWAQVPTLLRAVEGALREALREEGERVHVFTHLSHLYTSGSSIYTTFAFRLGATAEHTMVRWQRLKAAASAAIVAHRGTISHQHGVGLDHRPYLLPEKGPLGMAAMQAAYKPFDPTGLMNPGKLFVEEGV